MMFMMWINFKNVKWIFNWWFGYSYVWVFEVGNYRGWCILVEWIMSNMYGS